MESNEGLSTKEVNNADDSRSRSVKLHLLASIGSVKIDFLYFYYQKDVEKFVRWLADPKFRQLFETFVKTAADTEEKSVNIVQINI